MEIATSLRQLWHHRLWVILVFCLALLGSVALTQKIGLFPPSLHTEQGIEFGAASTSLLVDSPGSAVGDLRKPLGPLTNRTSLVATLVKSEPVQRRISGRADIPLGAVATSVTIPNPQNPNQPANQTAGEKASSLVGQSAAYQIAIAPVPEVPIINIFTQAPNGQKAISLARSTVVALNDYLEVIQSEGSVPRLNRVELRPLGGATGGNINSGASRSVTVLAFALILVAGCFVVLAASRIAEDIRVDAELEVAEHEEPMLPPVAQTVGDGSHPPPPVGAYDPPFPPD